MLRKLVDNQLEAKKRLMVIASMAKILHDKSNSFEDKNLSDQLDNIFNDLNKIVADF